jgi:hypothetical protein
LSSRNYAASSPMFGITCRRGAPHVARSVDATAPTRPAISLCQVAWIDWLWAACGAAGGVCRNHFEPGALNRRPTGRGTAPRCRERIIVPLRGPAASRHRRKLPLLRISLLMKARRQEDYYRECCVGAGTVSEGGLRLVIPVARKRGLRVQPPLLHSRRQLFANAAIAASRVDS